MTVQSSTFYVAKNTSIDSITPTGGYVQTWGTGIQMLGGTKTIQRRWVAEVNLFGAADEGRALNASDTVISAEIWGEVTVIVGTSGFTTDIGRITRADWDYLTATWNIYKTANNWTAAGGDISTPSASFSSPTATGYQKVTDQLVGLTNDAIVNQGGQLIIRIKANGEGATDHYFGVASAPAGLYAWARLIVTYESPQPGPTLMGLGAGII